MPLINSSSKKALAANIGEMIKAGHPADQAAAAAYRIQRRAKAREGREKKR
jgi:hypothetical protein